MPFPIAPPVKGDAAKASAATRNGEEGLLQGQEKGDILTPSLKPVFYSCAAKAAQPQPCLRGWRSQMGRAAHCFPALRRADTTLIHPPPDNVIFQAGDI